MTNKNQQKPSRKTHPNIDAIHTVDYAKFAEKMLGDMQTGEAPDPLLSILNPEKKTLSIESIRSELEQSLDTAYIVFETGQKEFEDISSWLPIYGEIAERDDLDWQSFCEGYQRLIDLDLDPVIIFSPIGTGLDEWEDLFSDYNIDLKPVNYSYNLRNQFDFANVGNDPVRALTWACSAYPMKTVQQTPFQISGIDEIMKFPCYQEYFTAQLYKKYRTGHLTPPGITSSAALMSSSTDSLAIASTHTTHNLYEDIRVHHLQFSNKGTSGYELIWVGAHSPVRLMKIDSNGAQT